MSDEDVTTMCGSVHPNYPDLKCMRYGGKCLFDDHIGILQDWDGFREIVRWGKHAEDEARDLHSGTYRIIPIKQQNTIETLLNEINLILNTWDKAEGTKK